MSADLQHAIAISFAGRAGHDRAVVYEIGDELVIALADGAGNSRRERRRLGGAPRRRWNVNDVHIGSAHREAIVDALRGDNLATTATSLIELVRLPNGELQDDAAVVIVR